MEQQNRSDTALAHSIFGGDSTPMLFDNIKTGVTYLMARGIGKKFVKGVLSPKKDKFVGVELDNPSALLKIFPEEGMTFYEWPQQPNVRQLTPAQQITLRRILSTQNAGMRKKKSKKARKNRKIRRTCRR